LKPQILHLDQVDSTNIFLGALSREKTLESGFVVWAEDQSAGRGQMGTSWKSRKGENLTFSIYIRWKDFPIEEQFLFQQMISLSLVYILESYGLKDLRVKWPNDIYCGDEKIAGVLVENSLMGSTIDASIIGIGLNVNQKDFSEIDKRATSMAEKLNQVIDRSMLLQKISSDLLFKSKKIRQHKSVYQSSYLEQLYHGDGMYWYIDTKKNRFQAKIQGIDSIGRLILEKLDGTCTTYDLKEVTFLNDLD